MNVAQRLIALLAIAVSVAPFAPATRDAPRFRWLSGFAATTVSTERSTDAAEQLATLTIHRLGAP